MKFTIFPNLFEEGECLTRALFKIISADLCEGRAMSIFDKIAECKDDEERQQLKKKLPAVTWQAHFPNGRRKNDEAVPTALYMNDFDHIESPSELYEKIKPLIERCDIVIAHETPSRHGLRLVAKCRPELTTIGENQEWLAARIVESCPEVEGKNDRCVKDFARLSYMVPESYYYYFDDSIWDWEPDPAVVARLQAGGGSTPRSAPQPSLPAGGTVTASEPPHGEPMQHSFRDIPLEDVAEGWLERRGGHPKPGERNTVLYQLAIRMRYITDFDPAVIAAHIPRLGLPEAEIQSLCASACRADRLCDMPHDLKEVLEELAGAAAEPDEEAAQEPLAKSGTEYARELPKLPIGLRESLIGLPEKSVMPVLCGVLPLAMAYATDVSACYADGKEHRLSLMTVIVGPQASGKSCVRDVNDLWLRKMREDDAAGREAEERYKMLQRSRRAANLPPEPKDVILEVPFTVSCAQLLRRLKNAKGKHLYSFGEEIDTVSKTNGAGSWSQKTDLYRNAFDNSYWGQDYSNENSANGCVQVCYNFTVMGTERAVHKFFQDGNVENGMVGRMLFSQIDAKRFEHMLQYNANVTMTQDEHRKEQIERAVQILGASSGPVAVPGLNKAIREWCDAKADEAREADDNVLDTFRKRAAVIGFRCGVLYQLLETGEKGKPQHYESKDSIAFALLMAEYALQNQCDLFGEQLLLIDSEQSHAERVPDELLLLPDTFDLRALRDMYPQKGYNAVKMMASRWKTKGWVVSKGNGVYQKTRAAQSQRPMRSHRAAPARSGSDVGAATGNTGNR